MDAFRAAEHRPPDLDDGDRGRRRRAERHRDARGERRAVRPRAAPPAPRPDRPRSAPELLRAVRRVRRGERGGARAASRRWSARPTGSSSPTRISACAARARCSTPAVGDARPQARAARRGPRAGQAGAGPGVRGDRRRPAPRGASRAAPRAPVAVRVLDRLALPLLDSHPASAPPERRDAGVGSRHAGDRREREGDAARPGAPGVRPVSDRAREGLFSSLGARSSGRPRARSVRRDRRAGDRGALAGRRARRVRRSGVPRRRPPSTTTWTARELADRATVVTAGRGTLPAGTPPADGPFDLVLLDPPYDVGRSPAWTGSLAGFGPGWLSDQGWTVVLTRGIKSSTPVIPVHWAVARQLRYGDSLVILYREVSWA